MTGQSGTDRNIRMVVLDLDGTALNSRKELTEATLSAVYRCCRRGTYVILASARPPRSVRPYYDQCSLATPIVNYNGALVFDPIHQQALLHLPIDPEVVRKVVRFARGIYSQTLVSLEMLDHWYTDRVDPRYTTEVAKSFQPDAVGPIESFLTEPVTKLMLLGSPIHMFMLRKKIEHEFRREITLVSTEDYMLQVMRKDASKSAAVRMLAQRFQVPRHEVLAIGDAPNDIGMIQWAGVGVAMENACPEAKAIANYVTRSNDADGVAFALEMFVL